MRQSKNYKSCCKTNKLKQKVLVGFKTSCKNGQTVNVSDVRGKGAPQAGGRVTEGSGAHGGQTGWGHREIGG